MSLELIKPDLDKLVVNEHKSEKYPPRTYYNATSANLTIALATDLTTAGEKLTRKAAGEDKYLGFQLEKGTDAIEIARHIYRKMKKDNVKTLNIAGNGIYTLRKENCTQDDMNGFVFTILSKIHQHLPIEKIYTGGQTGVDLAGAVSGYLLGIPTEVTLPNGFRQRFDHEDLVQDKQTIVNQITTGAENIIETFKSLEEKPTSTKLKP